jgi:cytochrome b561
MGTGALSLGVKRQGREADRGKRMSGAIPPFPNTPSWHRAQLKAQEQLYLYAAICFSVGLLMVEKKQRKNSFFGITDSNLTEKGKPHKKLQELLYGYFF